MPSSARMGAAAKPCFPPSQAPPAFPLPWPLASPAPVSLASLARGARPNSRTPVLPSVPKWAAATSRPQAAHSASACLDGQVSSVSFRTSALPTPASMEGCVWPHTPRSNASAHPASRAMPANTISTSVSWTRDLAPRALPAITRWDLSGVSAPLGERIHTVTFSQDPAPLVAAPMGAPVSCFQEETLPSISASAPKVSQARTVRRTQMTVLATSVRMGALARMGWAPTAASAQRPGQVGIALKMWTNVRLLVPHAAEMVVRARTRLAASTACV